MRESAATLNAFERLRRALEPTPHRRVRPPPAPERCSTCPADTRTFSATINGRRYCLRCAADALAGAT